MEKREGRRMYHKGRGQKGALGKRERRRLLQLGICLALFLTAFFLKGGKTAEFWSEVKDTLQSNTDFAAVLLRLEQAQRSERPWGETVYALCRQMLSLNEETRVTTGKDGLLYRQKKSELIKYQDEWVERDPIPTASPEVSQAPPEPSEVAESETPAPEPTLEPEWIPASYTGTELPENTSMDWYNLHLEKIVTPVAATTTSSFGWRENPIEGGQQFHHGVDLGVPLGTDVLAFAAGTVEYIGENDIYGLYLQIDHGNGVKSFYAHCSKLCVRQGRTVEAGEKVAESGETGNATGPHLHLELKRNGIFLNPLQYLSIGDGA